MEERVKRRDDPVKKCEFCGEDTFFSRVKFTKLFSHADKILFAHKHCLKEAKARAIPGTFKEVNDGPG